MYTEHEKGEGAEGFKIQICDGSGRVRATHSRPTQNSPDFIDCPGCCACQKPEGQEGGE
jgi:hypothetical protein